MAGEGGTASKSNGNEVDKLRTERDFYRRLLLLGARQELKPLLEAAVALIVEVTGAAQVYVEIRVRDEADGDGGDQNLWWLAHGCSDDDVEAIRASTSRGIVAEALGTGRTIRTVSALVDPRFRDRVSVREHGIEAVLCAPIGTPPLGVVYLRGGGRPGGFDDDDAARAELLAQQLEPLADRLVGQHARERRSDHTRAVRARLRCDAIVGRSAALADTLEQAALVAPLDIDVLLTGPSGTGKTALAKIIAANSRRADGPFVELNCAALPENLLESELFGAVRGAHSTAIQTMPGKIEAACGGTLFLDEIGELSLGSQAKLLQLLQSRRYYRLGATEPSQADVRVISATNLDLLTAVAERRFREDLYYRVHVVPVRMPALTERREDIELLVQHFVEVVAARHRLPGKSVSRAALLGCREAPWPGNVRELANAIEAAVIRAHGAGGAQVQLQHIFPERLREDGGGSPSFQEATRQFQRRFLSDAFERNEWNIAAVARELSLTRSHVYNLIHAHGLRRRPS